MHLSQAIVVAVLAMNAVTICGEGGIQNTDLSVAETAFTEEEGSPVVLPKTVDDTPLASHGHGWTETAPTHGRRHSRLLRLLSAESSTGPV